MQRIAILLLSAGLWSGHALADACDNVGTVVGGFAGGATGYGLVSTLGAATTWVSAGLYGAGIAVASLAGRSAGETGCNTFSSNFERIGEMYCENSGFDYDCGVVRDMTMSIAADFVLCSTCTYDEVFGAFLLADDSRERFLESIQRTRQGFVSPAAHVLPRDQLGAFDSSVADAYFVGLQTGFTLLSTRTMSVIGK